LRDILASKAVEAGSKLTVRSALNPMLWLSAIITIPALAFVGLLKSAPTWIIVLAFAPVATAIFGFLFLLIIDRDKLQSEDYQIRRRSLELIEEKGDKYPLLASAIHEIIANPELPLLPPGEEQ